MRLFVWPALHGGLVSAARLPTGQAERNEGFRRSFAVFRIRSGGNMGIPDMGRPDMRNPDMGRPTGADAARMGGASGTCKRKRPHRQAGAGEVSMLETGRQVMKSAPASP
jgi:hypothetical protein